MRIFPESALVQLEFDKVKTLLAEQCNTEFARTKAEELRIHTRRDFIDLELRQTNEFKQLTQNGQYFPNDHILNRRSLGEFLGFGALTAILAYGNFLFFFIRAQLSPAYIDTSSQLYARATILTYLTIVLCQFVNLLFVRADEHESFFTNYLWSNKKLLAGFAISFFLIANIMYNPWIQPYFGAGPLNFGDWLTAVVCAGLYFAVRLSQRYTRKHSRHAVLELHHQVYGSKA